jgi:hypothetical protein
MPLGTFLVVGLGIGQLQLGDVQGQERQEVDAGRQMGQGCRGLFPHRIGLSPPVSPASACHPSGR